MTSSSSSFQIEEDDKFFSRLLSKENSGANPSFRVYYAGLSGSVPFTWESQPGTPKHTLFSDSSLPPLTPPPSYYSTSNSASKPAKKHSRSGLLHALFPKMTGSSLKKTGAEASSPTSSSSSSSSLSSSSSFSSSSMFLAMSPRKYRKRNRLSTPGSSFDSRLAEDDEAIGSPTSTLCFAISRGRTNTVGKLRGCYGW